MNDDLRSWPFNGRHFCDGETISSIEAAIAAAFRLCDLTNTDIWSLPSVDSQGDEVSLPQESQWLRFCFLRCLDFGLDANPESGTLYEDFGEETRGIELGRENGPEWVRMEWRFNGRFASEDGGDWMFSLSVSGEESTDLIIANRVMSSPSHVRETIRVARHILEGGRTKSI